MQNEHFIPAKKKTRCRLRNPTRGCRHIAGATTPAAPSFAAISSTKLAAVVLENLIPSQRSVLP